MEEVRTPLPTTAVGASGAASRPGYELALPTPAAFCCSPRRRPVLWFIGESFSAASYFRGLAITYFLCFLFGQVVSAKQNRTEGNSRAFFSLHFFLLPSLIVR